jgi:hypothetical protein
MSERNSQIAQAIVTFLGNSEALPLDQQLAQLVTLELLTSDQSLFLSVHLLRVTEIVAQVPQQDLPKILSQIDQAIVTFLGSAEESQLAQKLAQLVTLNLLTQEQSNRLRELLLLIIQQLKNQGQWTPQKISAILNVLQSNQRQQEASQLCVQSLVAPNDHAILQMRVHLASRCTHLSDLLAQAFPNDLNYSEIMKQLPNMIQDPDMMQAHQSQEACQNIQRHIQSKLQYPDYYIFMMEAERTLALTLDQALEVSLHGGSEDLAVPSASNELPKSSGSGLFQRLSQSMQGMSKLFGTPLGPLMVSVILLTNIFPLLGISLSMHSVLSFTGLFVLNGFIILYGIALYQSALLYEQARSKIITSFNRSQEVIPEVITRELSRHYGPPVTSLPQVQNLLKCIARSFAISIISWGFQVLIAHYVQGLSWMAAISFVTIVTSASTASVPFGVGICFMVVSMLCMGLVVLNLSEFFKDAHAADVKMSLACALGGGGLLSYYFCGSLIGGAFLLTGITCMVPLLLYLGWAVSLGMDMLFNALGRSQSPIRHAAWGQSVFPKLQTNMQGLFYSNSHLYQDYLDKRAQHKLCLSDDKVIWLYNILKGFLTNDKFSRYSDRLISGILRCLVVDGHYYHVYQLCQLIEQQDKHVDLNNQLLRACFKCLTRDEVLLAIRNDSENSVLEAKKVSQWLASVQNKPHHQSSDVAAHEDVQKKIAFLAKIPMDGLRAAVTNQSGLGDLHSLNSLGDSIGFSFVALAAVGLVSVLAGVWWSVGVGAFSSVLFWAIACFLSGAWAGFSMYFEFQPHYSRSELKALYAPDLDSGDIDPGLLARLNTLVDDGHYYRFSQVLAYLAEVQNDPFYSNKAHIHAKDVLETCLQSLQDEGKNDLISNAVADGVRHNIPEALVAQSRLNKYKQQFNIDAVPDGWWKVVMDYRFEWAMLSMSLLMALSFGGSMQQGFVVSSILQVVLPFWGAFFVAFVSCIAVWPYLQLGLTSVQSMLVSVENGLVGTFFQPAPVPPVPPVPVPPVPVPPVPGPATIAASNPLWFRLRSGGHDAQCERRGGSLRSSR